MSDRPHVTRSEVIRRTMAEREPAGTGSIETLVGYANRSVTEDGSRKRSSYEIYGCSLFVRARGANR